MNRRRFFQSLGAAILGTAIALRIPDNIIPIPQVVESDPIFGFTGFHFKSDSEMIKGRILVQLDLEIANPRFSHTIYIENC